MRIRRRKSGTQREGQVFRRISGVSQVKLAHFAIFYGFGVHCFENNSSCFMFLGHVILSTDGFSREDLEG